MIFAEDVLSQNGLLLAARGLPVTQSLLNRIRSSWKEVGIRSSIKVIMQTAH
jgi:hypothetical protein